MPREPRTREGSRAAKKAGARASKTPQALALARAAARLALEKKAEDVQILNLGDLSSVCDYFVLASGRSETQVKAIAERIEEGLAAIGARPWHREGFAGRRWILLDFVDTVVHVFHRETREYYMLERLWGDASVETVDE